MARAYISEYYFLTQLPGDAGQMPMEPPHSEQVVVIGAAAESVALNSATRFIRINTDAACSILVGIGRAGVIPTPALDITTGHQRFARDQTEFKGVPNGEGVTVKVAVIANV